MHCQQHHHLQTEMEISEIWAMVGIATYIYRLCSEPRQNTSSSIYHKQIWKLWNYKLLSASKTIEDTSFQPKRLIWYQALHALSSLWDEKLNVSLSNYYLVNQNEIPPFAFLLPPRNTRFVFCSLDEAIFFFVLQEMTQMRNRFNLSTEFFCSGLVICLYMTLDEAICQFRCRILNFMKRYIKIIFKLIISH